MHTSKGIGKKGVLIAFEGIDRAGKSSVVSLLSEYLSDCFAPIRVCGELQSPLAPIIRDILTRGGSPLIKTYLFAADRAWTYEKVCLPALKRGEMILWDRYVDSALVYRSAELSMRPSEIFDLNFVKDVNRVFMPANLTVYIDVSVDTSLRRASSTGTSEPYAPFFLEIVRREYLGRVAREPNYVLIDGERPLQQVTEDVARVIRTHFKELFP